MSQHLAKLHRRANAAAARHGKLVEQTEQAYEAYKRAHAECVEYETALAAGQKCCGMRDTYVNMIDRKLHCAQCGKLVEVSHG